MVALFVLPAAPAGAGSGPLVIVDPEGDSGAYPCSPAIDLLSFTADWGETGIDLGYTFRDLSVVESPAGLVQDLDGRCFYSYTDFVAEIDGGVFDEAIYIDHNSNPVFQTGWRIYLHESRIELPATINGNRIDVTLPYDVVGTPAAGDRIGDFYLQVVSALGGNLPREADWVPGHAPCGCWLVY